MQGVHITGKTLHKDLMISTLIYTYTCLSSPCSGVESSPLLCTVAVGYAGCTQECSLGLLLPAAVWGADKWPWGHRLGVVVGAEHPGIYVLPVCVVVVLACVKHVHVGSCVGTARDRAHGLDTKPKRPANGQPEHVVCWQGLQALGSDFLLP